MDTLYKFFEQYQHRK